MLVLIACLSLASQQPDSVALEYVRAHRRADEALVAGALPEARAAFERCLDLSPRNGTVAYGLACVAARGGEAQVALDWLERADEWGYADLVIALWDEDLSSVRGEARFTALLPSINARGHAPLPRAMRYQIYSSQEESWSVDAAIESQARFIATAETSGVVRILDARSGHELRRSPSLGSELWAVAFDDGERIAALTRKGTVHLWSADGSSAPRTIGSIGPAFEDAFLTSFAFGALLEFSADGERLLAAADGHRAALFSGDGELVKAWDRDFGAFFTVLMAWSPDGKTIATWEPRGSAQVQFLDGRSGEPSRAPLDTPAPVNVVAFHPGGRLLATGHDDARLRVWDLETGNVVYEREVVDEFAFEDEVPYVNVARFSPDGRRLAFVGGDCNDRFVVDVGTWNLVYSGTEGGGRMGEPTDIAWSLDGERFWCAFVSGPMTVSQIDLTPPISEVGLVDGRPPRVSAGGLAVIAGCITGIDATKGNLLWHRPDVGLAAELIQAPSGYFTSTLDLESLEDLVWFDVGGEPKPLAEQAITLFDPKRVRAARAGVALFPPAL